MTTHSTQHYQAHAAIGCALTLIADADRQLLAASDFFRSGDNLMASHEVFNYRRQFEALGSKLQEWSNQRVGPSPADAQEHEHFIPERIVHTHVQAERDEHDTVDHPPAPEPADCLLTLDPDVEPVPDNTELIALIQGIAKKAVSDYASTHHAASQHPTTAVIRGLINEAIEARFGIHHNTAPHLFAASFEDVINARLQEVMMEHFQHHHTGADVADAIGTHLEAHHGHLPPVEPEWRVPTERGEAARRRAEAANQDIDFGDGDDDGIVPILD